MAACGIAPSAIILEPKGRNTAATAALAALIAQEIDPEAHVLLAPADHLVSPRRCLRRDDPRRLQRAARPDRHFRHQPHRTRDRLWLHPAGREPWPTACTSSPRSRKSREQHLAQQYLDEGGYSWNSGVFLFSPGMMLEEFAIAAADIRDGARDRA